MIVARRAAAADAPAGAGTLHLVTQTDHAAFAAELLELWRADGLPENPRRAALIFATREHDNGWQGSDAAPSRRDDGRPHDFMSIPTAVRQEIWRRGVERHVAERPWAAALILQHALNLHRRHAESEPWREFLATWRGRRDELLETLGAAEAELLADYRLLDAADTLSLAVCAGWGEAGEHAGVRYHARLGEGRAELRLDPFPLAGATTFTVARRAIPDRPYGSDAALGLELASARWTRLPVRVVPLASAPDDHSLG